MRGPTPEEVSRYSRLIRDSIGDTFLFTPETELETSVQVERGGAYPMCLRGHQGAELSARVSRLIELASAGAPPEITVVDRAGQSRSAYLGLLVYSWVQAYRCCGGSADRTPLELWRPAIFAWCGMLEAALNRLDWPIGGIPAARGSAVAASVWNALSLFAAGSVFDQRRWIDIATNTFGRLSGGQQHGGAFLRTTASDNPETRWYNELVILHAATSYAAQSNDTLATASVMQAAEYHARETQPDHATTQPWGLHAFIWRRDARELADAMLHAVRTRGPGNCDGVSSQLLADALYCLRLM
jgi:hypothetical protein